MSIGISCFESNVNCYFQTIPQQTKEGLSIEKVLEKRRIVQKKPIVRPSFWKHKIFWFEARLELTYPCFSDLRKPTKTSIPNGSYKMQAYKNVLIEVSQLACVKKATARISYFFREVRLKTKNWKSINY